MIRFRKMKKSFCLHHFHLNCFWMVVNMTGHHCCAMEASNSACPALSPNHADAMGVYSLAGHCCLLWQAVYKMVYRYFWSVVYTPADRICRHSMVCKRVLNLCHPDCTMVALQMALAYNFLLLRVNHFVRGWRACTGGVLYLLFARSRDPIHRRLDKVCNDLVQV
jgi:hypothetical protein